MCVYCKTANNLQAAAAAAAAAATAAARAAAYQSHNLVKVIKHWIWL